VTHGLDTSFLVATEVACHADHAAARSLAGSLRQKGDQFAVVPQALAEFVHIVTDAKRFTAPLTVPQAVERAQIWWNAVSWFFAAMNKYQLGRKRVLDTLLAGTFRSANIVSLLTLNAADFAVFGEFTSVPLAAPTTQR